MRKENDVSGSYRDGNAGGKLKVEESGKGRSEREREVRWERR